jgi:hypothetical protein
MQHIPPALAAKATPRILELLGSPPGRVVEIGFGGIHAAPLRIAGFDVTVVARDDAERERALARAGDPVYHEAPRRTFDAVVAPEGVDVSGIDAERRFIVAMDGTVHVG